jgi:manganese/zinc/iron transport system substrate-binding protein
MIKIFSQTMNVIPLPRFRLVSLALLSIALLAGTSSFVHAQKKVRVTATVTMLSDLVANVGGERVEVQALMGPGVDPHLYKATAADVAKLRNADVIFYVGLLLEGKMQNHFTELARRKKFVYAVTEGIPEDQLLEPEDFGGHYDPHVWFDPTLWARCADVVASGLSEFDPAGRRHYETRAAALRKKLEDLHRWSLEKVSELPPERRILVTSHDAYNYFGRAYGFQVVGLQGISTVTEAGLADVTKLVDFIKANQVKAIFVESSVPPTAIQRISRDARVKIGGELFSDALGTPGQIENGYDLGTYEGMVRHNITTIVEALK